MERNTRDWRFRTGKRVRSELAGVLAFALATACSSGPKASAVRILDEREVEARIADPDCRYQKFNAGEAPEPLVSAFLSRESRGHLHADELDWLFQRQLCPGRETIPDFVQVVASRSLRLVAQTADRREFEAEYEVKGTLLLDGEGNGDSTPRWNAKDRTVVRKLVLYRTNEGWKFDAPVFGGGEYLSPASVIALYGKRLDPSVSRDFAEWIR